MKTFLRRKYSFAALASIMLVSQCCCCFLPIGVQLENERRVSRISAPAQAAGVDSQAAGTQALCWDEKLVISR